MTALEFIDALLGRILSWPVLLLVAALIFRNPVAELIRATSRVRWGDKDLQFDRFLDEAEKSASETQDEAGPWKEHQPGTTGVTDSQEEDLLRLAEDSPSGAVLVAWARLEKAQVDLAEGAGVELGRARHPHSIAERLASKDLLPPSYPTAIEDLRRLRAVVAHGEHVPSVGEAATYVQQVEKLRQVLRNAQQPSAE